MALIRLSGTLFIVFLVEVASKDFIYYNQIKHISEECFKEYDINSLTFLDFRGCKVEDVASTAFVGMTNLKTIVFTYNNIQHLPANVLYNLENLELFECRSNKLEHISKYLFLNLRKLTLVNLGYNLISSIKAGTFNTNTKLNTLYLNNNLLTVIPIGVFNMLKELTYLDLSDNLIYKIEESALPNFQNLRTLRLHSNKLQNFEDKYVNSLTSFTSDRNPWFCDCRIKKIHDKWKSTFSSDGWTPVCNTPKKLHNVRWDNLDSDDFKCEKITLMVYPENYEIPAEIGRSVSLNCYIKGLSNMSNTTWTYKNNTKVIDILQDTNRSCNVQFGIAWRNEHSTALWNNLTINNVKRSDEETYKCVSNHENNIYEIETRVIVEDNSLIRIPLE